LNFRAPADGQEVSGGGLAQNVSGNPREALARALPGLWPGGALALGSAALFGVATPAAKLLLGTIDPWLLAGLLYFGAGVGLWCVRLLRQVLGVVTTAGGEAPLGAGEWPWLAAAIFAGGIAGPVLLMVGLARTPAATTSLLLNLEGVFTALIAWLVFREHFNRRIGLGLVAICGGALALAWQDSMSLSGLAGPLLVAGACLAWAADNNLTRQVSLKDPIQIAMLKGLIAGGVNLAIALGRGAEIPLALHLVAAATIGFLGYGVSLVLFVLALRHVGTARTGAYFSAAPFVGAAISVAVLGESLSVQLLAAGALMGLGVWLHLSEIHSHEHEHQPMVHTHRHHHEEHHQHAHGPDDPPGEPHTHRHAHARLRHAHPHYPDVHHRHSH
jgi:drug/metabolite transporter (DMT)-like permease